LGTADVDYAGFFPGEGNIYKGGKAYYLPENKLFSTKQVVKHTILAGKGGWANAPSSTLLRTHMRTPSLDPEMGDNDLDKIT